jgi:hypothetical protein
MAEYWDNINMKENQEGNSFINVVLIHGYTLKNISALSIEKLRAHLRGSRISLAGQVQTLDPYRCEAQTPDLVSSSEIH